LSADPTAVGASATRVASHPTTGAPNPAARQADDCVGSTAAAHGPGVAASCMMCAAPGFAPVATAAAALAEILPLQCAHARAAAAVAPARTAAAGIQEQN